VTAIAQQLHSEKKRSDDNLFFVCPTHPPTNQLTQPRTHSPVQSPNHPPTFLLTRAHTQAAVSDAIKAVFVRYNRDLRDPVEIPGLAYEKRARTPAREDAAAAEHGAASKAAASAHHGGQLVPPPRQGSPPLVLVSCANAHSLSTCCCML
jgi:hypothetical protein